MLIVRRRPGQSISIGDEIEIQIIDIGAARVKIGVRAPSYVSVQRTEVSAVRAQNVAAAALGAEERDAIVNRFRTEDKTKTSGLPTDKPFEARYAGHPEQQENLELAGRQKVSLTGR